MLIERFKEKVAEIYEFSMWRCDPIEHVEDQTFFQLTRLLQVTIEYGPHVSGYKGQCSDAHGTSIVKERRHCRIKVFGLCYSSFSTAPSQCEGTVFHCVATNALHFDVIMNTELSLHW